MCSHRNVFSWFHFIASSGEKVGLLNIKHESDFDEVSEMNILS